MCATLAQSMAAVKVQLMQGNQTQVDRAVG